MRNNQESFALETETKLWQRPIPVAAIILLALAIHGPLLIMELPATTSYDANLHIFFASHYAHHWFNPWNQKWFAGFSQTTYPPLTHQWIALLSHIVGLTEAFMLVQLVAVVLLAVATYRFAQLWVDDRAASYAGVLAVFAGSIAFLVYSAGQLPTTMSAPLYFLALPYFYSWCISASWRSLLKGIALTLAAASAHHVTLLFGSVLFAAPVLWLAWYDGRKKEQPGASIIGRGLLFAAIAAVGIAVVLLPYWIAIIQHPIEQMPIPHASRSNYLMNWLYGMNYFIVPYGALILALPFIVIKGASNPRLRILLLAFWVTFLIALGGTTPVPRWIFGRAFEILTYERFTLWATVLALPIVGLLVEQVIDRFPRWGTIGVSSAAVATLALALGWLTWSPFKTFSSLDVDSVVAFLNRDGHDQYRYLTLGFGNALSKVSTYANASSVDGEYNSARLLPEMTRYGAAQLTNAKFFGAAGMDSIRAMLEHANHYGLKFVFVHDPFYEPLLVFGGWRQVESYNSGSITVWSKDDAPPARVIPSDAVPAPWEGWMWGILPMGSSLLAILFVCTLGEPRRVQERIALPRNMPEDIYANGVRS
ncbi:MAG: 6-pyruvoyl-tetrahydropterin synthase-related protein [Terriglobales bacterium]